MANFTKKDLSDASLQTQLMIARTKLTDELTIARRLKNAALQGELCNSKTVRSLLERLVRACVDKLNAMPYKMASRCSGADAKTIETCAKDFINEAIDELRVDIVGMIEEKYIEDETEDADDRLR